MASAAGRSPDVRERRKQRALDAFQDELAQLDAEEIQARLDSNRIRSSERRTIARRRLRALRSEQITAAPSADEAGNQQGNHPRNQPENQDEPLGYDEQSVERATTRDAESGARETGDGAEREPAAAAAKTAAEEHEDTQVDDTGVLPLARRIGRFVGMTAAVGGVVLAGAWLIRR